MDAAGEQAVCEHDKQRCTAGFSEQMQGQPVGIAINKSTDHDGKYAGENKTDHKIGTGAFFPTEVALTFADGVSYKFGDGSLDGGGCQCKAHGKNRGNQLIDSQSLCTNCAREEYSIEETYDTADNTGRGHEESAGDKWIFGKTG